jgi:hypothetical protein
MPSLSTFLSHRSGALSLVVYGYMIELSEAVCLHCHGNIAGCDNTGNNCPAAKEMVANAAAVTAGLGAMLTLRYTIPSYFSSHFPMSIMSQLSALAARRSADQAFVFTDKSAKEIVQAVTMGFATGPDAVSALMDLLRALDSKADDYDVSKIEIEMSIKQIEINAKNGVSLSPDAHGVGVLYFAYCKCSALVWSALSSTSTSLPSTSGSLTRSSGSTAITATLHRPASEADFARTLNHWVLICDALGVAKAVVTTAFIDRVVWRNVSELRMDWPVAHELFLLYIRKVDSEGDYYSLPSVVQKLGGLDTFREEAFHSAHSHWPSACFRSRGENPRETGRSISGNLDMSNFVECVACNDGASSICKWYNIRECNGKHDPADVDSRGRCKHRHCCNQFVTDKGKNGRCEGKHPRFECDYDRSKRCKKPVQ